MAGLWQGAALPLQAALVRLLWEEALPGEELRLREAPLLEEVLPWEEWKAPLWEAVLLWEGGALLREAQGALPL